MSEFGKTDNKSDADLSYSDLRKLFQISEIEPIENYGGRVRNIGKSLYDYDKFAERKASEEKTYMELPSQDTDGASAYSQNSFTSEKSTNYSKSKEDLGFETKILFQSSRFYLQSKCDSSDQSNDDERSVEYSLTTESMLEEFNGEVTVKSGKKESKTSFLNELCEQLSFTSNYKKRFVKNTGKERSIYDLVDLDNCLSAWNHEIPSHKMGLDECLNRDLDEHVNLSVWVCFGRIHFHCHKFVLRCCQFFRQWEEKYYMFKPEHGITAKAFSIFYVFAMGQKPKIPSHLLLDVLNVARTLDGPDLENYCMKLLDSNLYQENEAFQIFKAAKAQNLPVIQHLIMQRIIKFFLPLVASKEFIEMDLDDVCKLLECDTIGVNSEIEVFFTAILWLDSKWQDRNDKIIQRVMSCVRYALIPPWFTYSLKKSTGIVEVDRVVKQKAVSKMIENGASIAATISLFFLDNAKFGNILKRLQTKIPKQRYWIYDKNCTYHYGAHERVSKAVDYVVFKDYLRLLEMEEKNYWCKFQTGKETHFAKIFCQQFLDTAWSKVHF